MTTRGRFVGTLGHHAIPLDVTHQICVISMRHTEYTCQDLSRPVRPSRELVGGRFGICSPTEDCRRNRPLQAPVDLWGSGADAEMQRLIDSVSGLSPWLRQVDGLCRPNGKSRRNSNSQLNPGSSLGISDPSASWIYSMDRVRFGAGLTLFLHWLSSVRVMIFKSDAAEVQHVDFSDSPHAGKAINARLIFTCVVFGAASFLFGFDDKIISPVAALPAFVSGSAKGKGVYTR